MEKSKESSVSLAYEACTLLGTFATLENVFNKEHKTALMNTEKAIMEVAVSC